MTPASIIPVLGSRRPYADLNFAGGSFGVGGQIVSDITRLPGFTFTRASTAMFYGSNGLLQTAGSGVARFAYDPVTLASQGILVEEARTNLALQSQTFDNAAWGKTRTTVTADTTTSPDGTSNADKLVTDSSAAIDHRIAQSITTVAGQVYTISVFASAAELSQLVVYAEGTNVGRYFDLATGSLGGTLVAAPTASSITNVGGGWYRCSITFTASTTSTGFRVYLAVAGSATFDGDGVSGLYIWGAQAELGTGASSPIPTTTASVTRAADVATVTGVNVPDGCTVTLEGRIPAFITTDARAGISTNDNANRIWFVYNGTTLTNNVTVAGSSVGVLATAIAPNAAFKAATAVVGGAYRASLNGGAVGTGVGATVATMTQVDIGTGIGGGSRHWNNTISRIRIYNRALSNAELQAITT